MSVIKMYIQGSAAALVSAQIDIPADGTIYAASLYVTGSDAGAATGEQVNAELSFISTPQYASNDSRGSILQVNMTTQLVVATNFNMVGPQFAQMSGLNIKINAGERIYLHMTPEGSINATSVAYLYVEDGMDQPRALRRR